MKCYEFEYSFEHEDTEVFCRTHLSNDNLVDAVKHFFEIVCSIHGKEDLLSDEGYGFDLTSVQEVDDEGEE